MWLFVRPLERRAERGIGRWWDPLCDCSSIEHRLLDALGLLGRYDYATLVTRLLGRIVLRLDANGVDERDCRRHTCELG